MSPAVALEDRLVVTPLLDVKQIGPASIDLRLSSDFLTLRRNDRCGIDPIREEGAGGGQVQAPVSVPLGRAIWLQPQQFMLGATLEFIRLPANMMAYVVGRSSWGRMGLVVATAIMVQPGFAGSLTLELANEGDSPIRLYPGLRVAQLVVHATSAPADDPYDPKKGSYSFPVGPGASKAAWKEDEMADVQRLDSVLGRA
jgi:dCTP deaminase